MPQLSIKQFFSKSEKTKENLHVIKINVPVQSCSKLVDSEKKPVLSEIPERNPVASCSKYAPDQRNGSVAVAYSSEKKSVVKVQIQAKKLGLGANPRFLSRTTPPSSPSQHSNTEVGIRWKQLLDDYDKNSKSPKNRKRETTKKRQNDKKCQLSPKKLPKVEIDVESLTDNNFTEQLLALELIKDYLDQE